MKAILKKLHKIQSEVGKMEKDGKNTFQNYNYLSETQVTVKMKKLLEENGVVFTHSSTITKTFPFMSAKGVQNFLTNIEVEYSFYDIETGEVLTGTASGQGTDSGDKGIYKGITGAIKYIFMKNFMIPTGDDPEYAPQAPRIAQNTPPAPQTPQTVQSTPTPQSAPPQPEYMATGNTQEAVEKLNNYKKPERDEPCEKCGKPMVIRTGKYGEFLSCSGYPECKNIRK